MAVFPNQYCRGFCYWMLNTSWQVLTPPRITLITTVYNAALAGTSVSDQDYNNFVQTTSWRQPYYDSWLQNNTPFSTPPVGTCDVWAAPAYLKKNISSSPGTVDFSGSVTRINDLLGGACFFQNALAARNPFITNDIYSSFQRSALGFNSAALSNILGNSYGTFTQNTAGYTIFVVANNSRLSAVNYAFAFSTGTSANANRIALRVDTNNLWNGRGRRLDADAEGNIGGVAATNAFQIVGLKIDYSTGQGKMFVNGTLVSTAAGMTTIGNTSNTPCTAVTIGCLNQASIWNGSILDCLAFQTALSDVNMISISSWLNSIRSIY